MPLSQQRPALAAILVAFVAVLTAFAAQPASAAPTPSNPVVQRAMRDLGTYQGQCWTWIQQVVLEATGAKMGFDYRYGYLEGGAVEVSLEEAGPGDIVQIIDDNWTEPDADYPGMHTGLIIAANGNGSFEIIDSNQNFDGMVNLRSGYKPAELAASRGLNFHIYRFGTSPAAQAPVAEIPTVAGPVAAGDTARINTPGDCLRLRTSPGGSVARCLGNNSRVTITGAPRTIDGTSWVPVETVAGPGWMAASFLLKEAPTASPSAAGDVKPVFSYRAFVTVASD